MNEGRSVLWHIAYLCILKCDNLLFLILVLVALTYMNLINVIIFFIYVGYTLFPRFFASRSYLLLLYAEAILLAQYVYALVQTHKDSPSWVQVIGINSPVYDPWSYYSVWRYNPSLVAWIQLLVAFFINRRTEFLGRDAAAI